MVAGDGSRVEGSSLPYSAILELALGPVRGACLFARNRACCLPPHHVECVSRKGGVEKVVGKELHAPVEPVGGHFERELGAHGDVRGDFVQRLLKGHPVEGARAVGEKRHPSRAKRLLARRAPAGTDRSSPGRRPVLSGSRSRSVRSRADRSAGSGPRGSRAVPEVPAPR